MNQLVIFDCDGVLVDSERLSSRAFGEVMRNMGINIDDEEVFNSLRGGSLEKSIAFIESRTGKKVDAQEIEKEYRAISFDLFRKHMKPIEGVPQLLSELTHAKCVCSNGPQNKIHLNLDLSGIDKHFKEEHIFSAYDINIWKPEPDLFLHAASKMGFHPEDCVVIEDSKHGAQAAKRAGIRCYGFTQDTSPDDFTQHGAIPFESMEELSKILSK